MSSEPEGELLARARRRDPEALAELCEQWYPEILKYMHYRVQYATAEDLAGEVLVRVLRNISSQRGSFRAWLYTVARSVVADHFRREKVRQTEPMFDEDHSADAAWPLEVTARQTDIREAMGRLTEPQAELIVLKFLQGLSNQEISEITGLSPGAIRAVQYRALSSLRRILESGGYGNG